MLEAMNVLVSCPSCRTLYRHAAAASGADRVRCSRCGSVFPLTGSAGAAYRVVEAPPVPAARPGRRPGRGAPMGIGMDDPSLAAKLDRAGADRGTGAERRPMTYRVLADEDPADVPVDLDETPASEQSAEVAAEPSRAPVRPRHGVLARGTIMLSCIGLGAVAGYLMASDLARDFRVGTAIGAAAGLIVAWGWLRWISRNS